MAVLAIFRVEEGLVMESVESLQHTTERYALKENENVRWTSTLDKS